MYWLGDNAQKLLGSRALKATHLVASRSYHRLTVYHRCRAWYGRQTWLRIIIRSRYYHSYVVISLHDPPRLSLRWVIFFYLFFCFPATSASLFPQSRAFPFAGQRVTQWTFLHLIEVVSDNLQSYNPTHRIRFPELGRRFRAFSHHRDLLRHLGQWRHRQILWSMPHVHMNNSTGLIESRSSQLIWCSSPNVRVSGTHQRDHWHFPRENRKAPKPTWRCRTSLACISCRARKVA